MDAHLSAKLSELSLSMFRKNFMGVFHGSISARIYGDRFIINKKEAIFDHLDTKSLIELTKNRDYRWRDASIDAEIHLNIYERIPHAKFITFTMPPYLTAYSMKHEIVIPKDYFGSRMAKEIIVYDPGNFDDWYERAPHEISRYFKRASENYMIIRGYGFYTYNRDPNDMAKGIAVIENSCRLMML